MSEKLTRSQRPDARLFRQVMEGRWISNRSYKTRKGAEAFLNSFQNRTDVRRDVTYSIHQSHFGEYFVFATNKKLQVKVEGEPV